MCRYVVTGHKTFNVIQVVSGGSAWNAHIDSGEKNGEAIREGRGRNSLCEEGRTRADGLTAAVF